MVKFYKTFALLLVMFAMTARAYGADRPIDIRIESGGDHYWACLITQDPNDPKLSNTSIRQLVSKASGTWTQIAKLQARAIDVAAIGDRLAVLTSQGEWQLFWQGGSSLGQPLPDGRVATRLAGSTDVLFAVTRAAQGNADPSLYQWTQTDGWSKLADLPAEATTELASIAVFSGRPWLAYSAADKIRIVELKESHWRDVCVVEGTQWFELVSGAPTAMLAWHGSGGRMTVYDVRAARPLPIQSLELPEPSDATIVDASLRLVTTDGIKITQFGYDQYGRGAKFGPDTIAQIDLNPQASREWVNVIIVGLLTALMLATLRQRPEESESASEGSQIQIAPLSRRVFAGLIDAIPFLIANAWFYSRMTQASYTPPQWAAMIFLPELIGMTIYVAHVTVSELIFGRSIGKLIFGLKVVTTEGAPVPAGRIVLRNLLRVIEVPLFLPFLLIVMTPLAQRLGDMAAKTLVVRDPLIKSEPTASDAPPQGE